MEVMQPVWRLHTCSTQALSSEEEQNRDTVTQTTERQNRDTVTQTTERTLNLCCLHIDLDSSVQLV